MKKIVAEVVVLENGALSRAVYCLGDGGMADLATTMTLCMAVGDAVREQPQAQPAGLRALLQAVRQGQGPAAAPGMPDMAINANALWIRPPMARPGGLCISNDFVPKFHREHGEPQHFTVDQAETVIDLATWLRDEIDRQGLEQMIGQRFEASFPQDAC